MCAAGGRGQSELLPPYNPLTIPCSLQEYVSLHVEAPHRVSDCLGRKRPRPLLPWPGCPLARVPGSPGRGPLLPLLPPGSSLAAALLRQRSGNLLFLVPTLGRKRSGEGNCKLAFVVGPTAPGSGQQGPVESGSQAELPPARWFGALSLGWLRWGGPGWCPPFSRSPHWGFSQGLALAPLYRRRSRPGETACLAAHGRQQLGFSGAS